MNPEVDKFFNKNGKWQKEFEALRKIILDCGLNEEYKWGKPCYTFQNSNIVLIHGFKGYCAILLFKGTLLKDPGGILIRQTDNVQAPRQVRFTSVQQIVKLQKVIKAYIYEAIELEKAGLQVPLKKSSEYEMAEEFKKRLYRNDSLKEAFNALSPGRQRAYLLYFSAPKQSKTREARVEKCVPFILSGKGLNDRN